MSDSKKYPNISSYKQAVIEPDSFATLKGIEILKKENELHFSAGNFAVVFKVKLNGKHFALKCFLNYQADRAERYKAIGKYLDNNPSPYFVKYKYLENEIWVEDAEYPILLMEWVEGVTLGDKIKEVCQAKQLLYSTFKLLNEVDNEYRKKECETLVVNELINQGEISSAKNYLEKVKDYIGLLKLSEVIFRKGNVHHSHSIAYQALNIANDNLTKYISRGGVSSIMGQFCYLLHEIEHNKQIEQVVNRFLNSSKIDDYTFRDASIELVEINNNKQGINLAKSIKDFRCRHYALSEISRLIYEQGDLKLSKELCMEAYSQILSEKINNKSEYYARIGKVFFAQGAYESSNKIEPLITDSSQKCEYFLKTSHIAFTSGNLTLANSQLKKAMPDKLNLNDYQFSGILRDISLEYAYQGDQKNAKFIARKINDNSIKINTLRRIVEKVNDLNEKLNLLTEAMEFLNQIDYRDDRVYEACQLSMLYYQISKAKVADLIINETIEFINQKLDYKNADFLKQICITLSKQNRYIDAFNLTTDIYSLKEKLPRFSISGTYLDTLVGICKSQAELGNFNNAVKLANLVKNYQDANDYIECIIPISHELFKQAPEILKEIQIKFVDLSLWLLENGLAHGDLKHDNIIIKPDGNLVLVDYDGMFVPALKGKTSFENGGKSFQHPVRNKTIFNKNLDDFSILIILASLEFLKKEPDLYNQYNTGGNIIFTYDDYINLPNSSLTNKLRNNDKNRLIPKIESALSNKALEINDLKKIILKYKRLYKPKWCQLFDLDEGLRNVAIAYYNLGLNVSCITPQRIEENAFANNIFKCPSHEYSTLMNIKQRKTQLYSYKWEEACGIGTFAGYNNLVVVDIDGCNDYQIVIDILNLLEFPLSYEWVTQSGSLNGYHIYIFIDKNEKVLYPNNIKSYKPNKEYEAKLDKIEFLYKLHAVLPPSIHRSGRRYRFINDSFPKACPRLIDKNKIESIINKFTIKDSEPKNDNYLYNYISNINLKDKFNDKLKKYSRRNTICLIDILYDKETLYNKQINDVNIYQISWYLFSENGKIYEKKSFIIKSDVIANLCEIDDFYVEMDVANVISIDIYDVLKELMIDIKLSDILIAYDRELVQNILNSLYQKYFKLNTIKYKPFEDIKNGNFKYLKTKTIIKEFMSDNLSGLYKKLFKTERLEPYNSEVNISIIYKCLIKLIDLDYYNREVVLTTTSIYADAKLNKNKNQLSKFTKRKLNSFEDIKSGIDLAIQHKLDIRFKYQKSLIFDSGEISVRTIKPATFIEIGETKSLCIQGYCYLRKVRRTFALSRISELVIDPPIDINHSENDIDKL